jgi:cytochrome c-type biogenesis protein CcmE
LVSETIDPEPTESPVSTHGGSEPEHRTAWLKISIIGVGLIGVIVTLLLTTDAGSAFSYTQELGAVVAAPESFAGDHLRLEGMLVEGSVQSFVDPCEWRFVIENDEHTALHIRFQHCVVPDTFRDDFGVSVIVQGELEEFDGHVSFLADELVAQCPSKYEMQERLEAGEDMPHQTPGVETEPNILELPSAEVPPFEGESAFDIPLE